MPSLPEQLQAGVYDLMVAKPHMPPDARYTPTQYYDYVRGYQWALRTTLLVMQATVERHKMRARTRRLEKRREQ